jgi:DNA processing protein
MDKWYKLSVSGVKRGVILKLMNEFNKYEDIFNNNAEELADKLNLTAETIFTILNSDKTEIKSEYEKYEKDKIKIISLKDERYPKLLKNISNPPPFIYVKGKVEFSEKAIGVVGTRRVTAYGSSVTEKIARELSNSGVTVVSGLALGVDGAAHEQSLNCKGDTIAVVGTGLDIIYPYENKKLWERMEREGTIISEYPLGTAAARWTFPERNRIIAGLSKGVVITESYKRGGALITGKIALDEGRELFAVPGNIYYPSCEGCNAVIKRGEAKLVTSVEDILEEFGWDKINSSKKKKELNLSWKEEQIYINLNEAKGVDELIDDTKMSAKEILITITMLELKGVVKSIPGGKYRRVE